MKGKKFFLLSLILAVIAAAVVFNYLNEMERQSKAAANLVSVYVASSDIPARTKLSASMFTATEIPQDALHRDAITDKTKFEGAYAQERLAAGEQVLTSRLVFEQSNSGLSYKVSEGHRALTIPVNSVSGVAGFVLPGDNVDAIVTIELKEDKDDQTVTRVVAENIKVLASGQFVQDDGSEQLVVETITLDAPVDSVTAIIQASERGSLRLVLRPAADESNKAIRAHRLSQFNPGRSQASDSVD